MEYRRINETEVDKAARFILDGLRPELYPSMRISRDKVHASILHFSRSVSDFHMVAFDGENIVGGIAVMVYPCVIFERSEATFAQFRAIIPGVGRKLLGMFKTWVDDQIHIRRVTFMEEFDADPRLGSFMSRYGFKQKHTALVYLKG